MFRKSAGFFLLSVLPWLPLCTTSNRFAPIAIRRMPDATEQDTP